MNQVLVAYLVSGCNGGNGYIGGAIDFKGVFIYLTETKSWKWEGEGEEGEKVSLKTHATARGMGKILRT